MEYSLYLISGLLPHLQDGVLLQGGALGPDLLLGDGGIVALALVLQDESCSFNNLRLQQTRVMVNGCLVKSFH